jgi:hypothetical protein
VVLKQGNLRNIRHNINLSQSLILQQLPPKEPLFTVLEVSFGKEISTADSDMKKKHRIINQYPCRENSVQPVISELKDTICIVPSSG